jgi:hypothetical protein
LIKSIFTPSRTNAFAWINLFVLVILLFTGIIEPYTVLFGYFLETIIIGIFNCFKIYKCHLHDKDSKGLAFHILFFCFHYGFFIAVQSIFLFGIFSFSKTFQIKEPFHLIDNFQFVLSLDGMLIMILVLSITQLMKYILDFILPKKYLEFSVNDVFFKPYVRIFIQQFVVILGSFFVILSAAPVIAALILIIIRFLVDVFLASIKKDSKTLDYLVEKSYDGKVSKEELRKQYEVFTE